ncbi:MAG: hypothetical protein K0S30_857 [Clostridia bacterium]|nr:hypothetical protein [Clostridia bacterium]
MDWTLFLIVFVVIAALIAGLYFWGKRLQKKYDDQQQLINQHKQALSIFVIDKKKDNVNNLKLPKQVKEQLPWIYKKRKMPVVIAKIGPQIQTLMCDEKIYNSIPTKKQIKVEMAGILIVKVLTGKLPEVKKTGIVSQIKTKAMQLRPKAK